MTIVGKIEGRGNCWRCSQFDVDREELREAVTRDGGLAKSYGKALIRYRVRISNTIEHLLVTEYLTLILFCR